MLFRSFFRAAVQAGYPRTDDVNGYRQEGFYRMERSTFGGVRMSAMIFLTSAAVPPTTALRWIKLMTDNGLFERVSDPVDGRRVFIRLSDGGAEAMMRYLGNVRWGHDQVI